MVLDLVLVWVLFCSGSMRIKMGLISLSPDNLGIDDVTPSQRMLELKQRILAEGKEQSSNLIDQYKAGKIKLKPG